MFVFSPRFWKIFCVCVFVFGLSIFRLTTLKLMLNWCSYPCIWGAGWEIPSHEKVSHICFADQFWILMATPAPLSPQQVIGSKTRAEMCNLHRLYHLVLQFSRWRIRHCLRSLIYSRSSKRRENFNVFLSSFLLQSGSSLLLFLKVFCDSVWNSRSEVNHLKHSWIDNQVKT